MTIAEQRALLETLRAQLQEENIAQALGTIDRSLQEIAPDTLLTTTQAAKLLRIGSVNTLKLMCKRGEIATVTRGNRTMIPVSEIERVQDSERVRGIRASDRVHETLDDFGEESGLTDEQMHRLERSRPGRLPWVME